MQTKLKKEVWIEISRLSFFSYDEKEEHSFYYIKDILGNIRQIVDKDGSLVVSYYYDAWGNIYPQYHSYVLTFAGETLTAEDVSNLNGLFYKGYYYDKENKLYYLITRYYDPEVGRFISPDDPQYLDFEVAYGYNRYAYCNNNPVMGYDPEGTFAIASMLIGALVGVIVAFASSTISASLDGEITAQEWIDISISSAFGFISGAVGATGLGSVAQFFIQGTLSAVEGMVINGINGKFDETMAYEMLSDFVFGGILSCINISKMPMDDWVKHGKEVIKYTNRRVSKYGIKEGFKKVAKTKDFKKFVAEVPKKFVLDPLKDIALNVVYNQFKKLYS